ncbi:alpha/beta hydrolase [Streptomyces sp. WAC 01529]|uniref:alpha/beta fold hydrolase n=1 Tax=Streptomyces sp. WAC 01529 TaxID=2203205 RepID=UPI000F6EC7FD|nr:alpha/beta hydrolase [Streptomyces sp. WAC 01529]AZM56272.1 alpha/beta hydrolase [Streptomyces sp. WAC 01529]
MTAGAPPRTRGFAGRDGIPLTANVWGEACAPPLLLLHGGGQTRHAWDRTGPRLATLGWQVIAPDLRGHGTSAWSPDGDYDLGLFADDVRAVIAELGGLGGADGPGHRPVLVGASLGGLSALLAAGEAPRAAIRALVLVDVAHRPDPRGARRIVEFMRGRPDGFTTVAEAAAAVSAYLPHRPRPDDEEAGLRNNLRRHGGRWVWHWDPRMLDSFEGRMDPPGMAERLLDAARRTDAPILLVRGGSSDVVREDIADEFCARVPHARRVDVSGAGHMVAGDRNDHFIDAIVPFLEPFGAPPAQPLNDPSSGPSSDPSAEGAR